MNQKKQIMICIRVTDAFLGRLLASTPPSMNRSEAVRRLVQHAISDNDCDDVKRLLASNSDNPMFLKVQHYGKG